MSKTLTTTELIKFLKEKSQYQSDGASVNYLRLIDEIERLSAIVEKLPKTADGVPVVPGMELFWTGDGFSEEKRQQVQSGLVRGVFGNNVNIGGSAFSPHSRYSTRELAETAKETSNATD